MVSKQPGRSRISIPNLLDHIDDALRVIRADRAGLFVDFDGTISRLAPAPQEAVISSRAAASLRRLAAGLSLVCVISGRAAGDLRDKAGLDHVLYVGNHGAEQIEDGRLRVVPGLEEYSQKIGRVLDGLKDRGDIPGLSWENKGYSAAVHFRAAKEPDLARGALQAALSNVEIASELQVFWGKMILEIRPPTGLHKGYALRNLVWERGLTGAIFIGDDLTDLDALVALKEMRDQGGVRVLGVAVVDEDTPVALVSAADYALRGVSEVEELLERLEA
jgi:trehalose 6-phosphate phosphatase